MADVSADPIEQLRSELQSLRRRVFELEEALRVERAKLKEREQQYAGNVVKMLRQKDEKLGEYAETVEKKNSELREAVEALEEKNQQLELWVSSLRLYQDIFEHESSLMIGVNNEARIVLFNKAATDHFGDGFAQFLFHDVMELDFSPFADGVAGLVRKSLESAKPETMDAPRAVVLAIPIGSADHLRGALLKITRK